MAKVQTNGNGKIYLNQSNQVLLGNDMSDDTVVATGSTEPRTLADRFADVINVKDFGAVGDGVTDDTSAFQAAIDYANSIGGALVYGKGLFLISNVAVKSNVVVSDTRVKQKVIESSAWNNIASCFNFASNCENSSIINCYFDGNAENQSVTYICCILLRGKNNSIKFCDIKNEKGPGIEIEPGCSFCSIENNHIYNSKRGILHDQSETKRSTYCKIIGNLVENLEAGGIGFITGDDSSGTYKHSAGVGYFVISNNIVKNVGLVNKESGGIGGYSKNNDHLLITNNIIDSTPNHAMHWGGSFLTISNNIINNIGVNSGSDNYSDAIFIRNWPNVPGETSVASHITITGNSIDTTISTNHGRGICIENSKDIIVSSNKIRNTQNQAIKILGKALSSNIRCNDVIISGNDIDTVVLASGIFLQDSDDLSVYGNTCKNANKNGILTKDSSRVVISDNIFNNNSEDGIRIYDTNVSTPNSSDIKVLNNFCYGNGSIGIWANIPFERVTFKNNTSKGNTVGQYAFGTFSNSFVRDNVGYTTKVSGTRNIKNGVATQHYLAKTPKFISCIPQNRHDVNISVNSVNSTNVVFDVYDFSGNAVTDNIAVYYEFSCE